MKFSTLVFAALSACNNAVAFLPQHQTTVPPRITSLSAVIPKHAFAGTVSAVASAVAGLTFAAQVSLAIVPENAVAPLLVGSSSSTSTLVSGIETMDFSMPSYGDAISGGSVKTKGDPPAFNPFGDFDFKKKESDVVIEDKKPVVAEEKKAPAPVVVDDEAAKAEEEPIFKMPSFRLPKIENEEVSAPPSAVVEEEEAPASKIPSFSMPKVSMPKVEATKYDLDIDLPKASKVDMPKADMPEMPKLEMPEMPKLDLPKFNMPKFEMPKMEVPNYDFDNIDLPKAPKVDIPKVNIPNPFAGGGSSSPADNLPLEPREVRDERARATRQDFLAAYDVVKEAEEALRALKEVREVKKSLAIEAKDLACADRPGGKLICLRNPFTAGF